MTSYQQAIKNMIIEAANSIDRLGKPHETASIIYGDDNKVIEPEMIARQLENLCNVIRNPAFMLSEIEIQSYEDERAEREVRQCIHGMVHNGKSTIKREDDRER